MINITAGHQDVRLLCKRNGKKKGRKKKILRIVFCWMPTGEKVRFSKLLRNQSKNTRYVS